MSHPRVQIEADTDRLFTTGDTIMGTVVVELDKAATVSSVVIKLVGISETHLSRVVDQGQRFLEEEEEVSTVLEEQVTVFPTHDLSGCDSHQGYKIAEGRHEFDFQFVLPTYSAPQGDVGARSRIALMLPPSTSDLNENAFVQYYLKAVVNRPSFGGSYTSVTKYFVFLPADDNISALATKDSVTSSGSDVLPGISAAGLWSKLGKWGRYRHKVCKDVVYHLDTDIVLTPGKPFRPDLSLTFGKKTGIIVDSLAIDLVAFTEVKAKNLKRDFDVPTKLYKATKLKVSIDSSKGMKQSLVEALGDPLELVIPEQIGPSFQTPNIRRSYYLLVKIKYSHRPGSLAVHRATLKLPVIVLSGMSLPDYETGHVKLTDRTFEQAPFYFHKSGAFWSNLVG